MLRQALEKEDQWFVTLFFEEIPNEADFVPIFRGVGQKNPGAFRATHLCKSSTFA
jgi:hypothetical protein